MGVSLLVLPGQEAAHCDASMSDEEVELDGAAAVGRSGEEGEAHIGTKAL